MKKIILLNLSIALLFSCKVSAQNFRTSGTMDHLENLKIQDATLEQRMELIENLTQKFLQEKTGSLTQSVPVVVPVVVHVIWNSTLQNIPDSQIVSQIDVLNEDYNRLNADTVNTPVIFQSVAASAGIQFCLAQVDPAGLPTTGIHRVQTSTISFTVNDNVKFAASGGTDVWNPNQYLNIWVCNLTNGILGYTQFPGGPASTAGVVIKYDVFGRVGNLFAPFDKGRTTTLEIGNYFHLYPIDNGNCNGSNANNCNTMGDKVCDTPPIATTTFGCPVNNPNTCIETSPFPPPYASDMPDQFTNFMDYSDDACKNLFTAGQAARMNATINVYYPWMLQPGLSCMTSLNESYVDKGIKVMPTVTNDYITVKSEYGIISKVSIYDELHRKVSRDFIADNSQIELDLSFLNTGIYFIEIQIDHQTFFRKIIKT